MFNPGFRRKIKAKKSPIPILIGLILSVLFTGTAGFMFFEKMTLLDSFFFTVISITTVGYGIPEKLSDSGKIFTLFLIMSGISTFLYAVSALTAYVVEGRLGKYMKARRNKKMIEKMTDHIIVVGAGRTGRYVITELSRVKADFVLIDESEDAIKKINEIFESELNYVVGNATEEDVLVNAGIERAKALVTTLPTDSLNVFTVLSARTLNHNLSISSKVNDITAIKKIIYAGATHVIAGAEIAGTRLARMATNPDRVKFLESFALGTEEYRMEEITLKDKNFFNGKSIKELDISKNTGAMIVAIRRATENFFAPGGDFTFSKGDRLVTLGKSESINKLIKMVENRG